MTQFTSSNDRNNRRALWLAGLLAAAGLSFFAIAQEESGDEADIGTDTTLVPTPSVYAPRAANALLLDVAKAGDHWVAVGQRGNILLSSDGKAWKQVQAPADVMLTRVRFLDASNGWAIGYDGAVLGTSDGGSNWKLLQFDAAWGRPYYDVLFFDAQNGLITGANGTLKRTADGGSTWTPVESPVLEDSPNLYNLVKLGDGSLLMAGERGFIARSKDQGASWQQLKSPYTGSYFGALAVQDRGALIFGLRGNAFYAGDIDQSAALSAEDLEKLRAEAADAEGAARGKSPVSEVAGWVRLASSDTEPLFGGAVGGSGVFLVGQNGRVMRADLAGASLAKLDIGSDINMNAALADGDGLITVGTSGVQRVTPR